MTECPACHQPLELAASALEVTCPACRAPIAVRITPVEGGAFRGGSVRDVALVPVAAPPETVTDRSTRDELHLVITGLGATEVLGVRPVVRTGLGAVLLATGALVTFAGQITSSSLGMAVIGAWLLYRGLGQILAFVRRREVRHLRLGKTNILSAEGMGDFASAVTVDGIAGFEVRPKDGGAKVCVKMRNGRPVELTELIPEDAAYWIVRRLREALRR